MPMTFTFNCPHHKEEETITLSDSYFKFFEGEVPCGGKEEKAILHIKITADGKQIEQLRVVKPPAGS